MLRMICCEASSLNLAGHAHTQNRHPYTANKHDSAIIMRITANSLDANTAHSIKKLSAVL